MLRLIRYFLASVLLVIALNAFGGGIYGMEGARDLPLSWLSGGPFTNYLIPSLFLFTAIGGVCLFSSVLLFRNSRSAKKSALLSGALLVFWIAIQVWMIGYISWLQPAVFISGIMITALSRFLPQAEMK